MHTHLLQNTNRLNCLYVFFIVVYYQWVYVIHSTDHIAQGGESRKQFEMYKSISGIGGIPFIFNTFGDWINEFWYFIQKLLFNFSFSFIRTEWTINIFVIYLIIIFVEREMSMPARNLAKKALRKRVKEVLGTLTAENKGAQSEIVTQKVYLHVFFYLS